MTLNWVNFKHIFSRILFFISLTLLSSVSIAGIYKWVDADGNIHYGQQRPTNVPSERMKVPQRAPSDTSTYKRPGKKIADANTTPAPANETEDETGEREETKAEKKQRLADCQTIRNNLATMKSRGRIRSTDKDGNTTYLSEEEKQARMKKSEKTLSQHCK